jgi:GNAT superfamily N-acetyltransferase
LVKVAPLGSSEIVVSLDLAQIGLRLDVDDKPADADVEVLPNGLEAFNESRWPGHQEWKPLAVFARDGETIVAGLAGETYFGWLFIKYLWVSGALRGRGIGRELVRAAEGRAIERGCHSAWVDTLQLPGARLLSQARLRAIRRTRLSAGLQAHLPQEAACVRQNPSRPQRYPTPSQQNPSAPQQNPNQSQQNPNKI